MRHLNGGSPLGPERSLLRSRLPQLLNRKVGRSFIKMSRLQEQNFSKKAFKDNICNICEYNKLSNDNRKQVEGLGITRTLRGIKERKE